jgi:hypothetical protein
VNPRKFDRSWRLIVNASSSKESAALFRRISPSYRGTLPFARRSPGPLGHEDDAQVMDEPLFSQLRKGFSLEVELSHEIAEPNVIFTDDPFDDFVWPKSAVEAAKFWVVVIDYHF